MSKFTFVVEYEGGKEPSVGAGTQILGGKLCSVSFFDYRNDFFTERQQEQLIQAIDDVPYCSEGITHEDASAIIEKVRLMTQ